MMVIAYVTSQYPATSHTFIRREIEQLRRLGRRVETFSIRRPAATEIMAEGARREFDSTTYILPVGLLSILSGLFATLIKSPLQAWSVLRTALHHRPPGARGFVYSWIYFVEAVVLARALQRSGAAHVHNHFANPSAIVSMLSAKLIGLPFSMTLHGISEFDYPAGLLLREKVEAAAFVACASWFVRAQAMRLTPPEQWSKFHVVRCGVELACLKAPEFPKPDATRSRLICVGRLSAEKGQYGLLEAMSGLPEFDLHLRFVGDGPQREALRDEVARLNLSDRVEFLGALPEEATQAQIAASDLLVLPSFMEGLPVVLMEAMALGTPVVAAHIAGVPELIDDGKSGLLFRPSDWAGLRDKIRRILDSHSLALRLRTSARRKVERGFDAKDNAAIIAALFDGCGARSTCRMDQVRDP